MGPEQTTAGDMQTELADPEQKWMEPFIGQPAFTSANSGNTIGTAGSVAGTEQQPGGTTAGIAGAASDNSSNSQHNTAGTIADKPSIAETSATTVVTVTVGMDSIGMAATFTGMGTVAAKTIVVLE